MPYQFWKRLGITKAVQYDIYQRWAVKHNIAFNVFQREMMRRGLSFRRADMLEDWRRAQAVERAKTMDNRWDAIRFWDDFIVKGAEERGISTAKYFREWKEVKEKIETGEELSVTDEEMWEAYRELWL